MNDQNGWNNFARFTRIGLRLKALIFPSAEL